MTATCEPIFKLLKKDQGCVWTDDCQRAFESIKEYLLEPPILFPLVEGRPLIMYLTVLDNSMGCCCTPKFALSFLKESPWILKFAFIQFQASNYQYFQENHSQGKNGHLHTEKSNFDFRIKIKSQKNHISSRHVGIWSLFHQKFQKSNFTLEK